MRIFNYVINVNDYGVKKLINISVKAETIIKANMAIMIAIVNFNYRNHDSNQYNLHSPRLVSIKQLEGVNQQVSQKAEWLNNPNTW